MSILLQISGLGGRIPIQVDEKDAGGSYVSSEDGVLDANDEIVFMAADVGSRATDTNSLENEPINETWYEILITDPVSPTKKGWAYLVRSSTLSHAGEADYVDYPSSRRVSADNYDLRFAPDEHPGLEYLTLNGSGTDILDRTKLRLIHPFFGTVTENALESPVPVLIKNGRVRVILSQIAADDVTQLASTETIYQAYASLVQVATNVNSSISVNNVRVSVDLNNAASGATFFNGNIPNGVTINGSPDETVSPTPLSRWSQVSHSTGRLIQVTDPTPAGGKATNFYRDDTTLEDTNLGESGTYGDSGLQFTGDINHTFTLQNALFILPALNGVSGNVGATYESYFFNPLQVCAGLKGGPCSNIFLPIIVKGS
ncbi:MAG: hypothetical protein HC875_27790 [Anaerolineales bacterium]|nr:hypothetical protein [Anaerolineales bacterium]